MDKHNFNIWNEITSPDYEFYFPPNAKPISRDEHKNTNEVFYSAFPDLHHKTEGIFADGNIVVVRMLGTATHKGEFMGMAPSDEAIAYSAISILEFEEGKIIREWLQADLMSLMQQLGMELKPKEGEK